MGIIVQKFGGTSVASADCIKKAAAKVVRAKEAGNQVVVTVSARAGMTDELINLAKSITPNPDPRELDVLVSTGEQMSIALMCMTLHAMGYPAISFTGAQGGICTDNRHTNARIQKVETTAIRRELDKGKIVVVAGFQGIDSELNITTLGRGASDLTAVALAAALKADLCEIYTDVDGVYTADPRIVLEARKLDAVSHDEILELASRGAKVLQSRCVEVAKKYHVPLCVRSTFNDEPGTVICSRVRGFENVPVTGVAICAKKSRITIIGLPDEIGVVADVVGALGEKNIVIDTLIQAFPVDGKADLSFMVERDDFDKAVKTCEGAARKWHAGAITSDMNIGRVAIVGSEMVNHDGVAATMCEALGANNINIKMITTSEIHMSVIIDCGDLEKALRSLHATFGLDKLPRAKPLIETPKNLSFAQVNGAMEGFHAQAIQCDRNQAELKIRALCDKPGQAARLLRALADAKIVLDIVLQNSCSLGMSVTMRREDVERAKRVIETMSPAITTAPVQVDTDIAKVSVSGVGLKNYAGAASKICGRLAREGISLRMIGTSEVQFTTVVPEADADRAVAALSDEFQLS